LAERLRNMPEVQRRLQRYSLNRADTGQVSIVHRRRGERMRLVVIPFYKYRNGASLKERMVVFEEWKRDMAKLNPAYFRPDGEPRGFWGMVRYLLLGERSMDGGDSLGVAERHEGDGDSPSHAIRNSAHSNPLSAIYPVHPDCMNGCETQPECVGYCRKPRTGDDKW
jgi:hypothetical protein